ncbi:MAG: hypothetical protein V4736_12120 [Bdellovibrionota bacterium]
MEIRRTRRPLDNEKYLVAEQPGMLILTLGLILGVMLGFTLKGLLNPSRVEDMLRQAARQIHRDVKIDFSSAHISLHSHGFPRIAVVVNDVILNAAQPCWMSPRLKADEMVLPVSIIRLISGGGPIDEVRLGSVQLWLADDTDGCGNEAQTDAKVVSDTEGKPIIAAPNRIKIKEESSKIPDNPSDVRKISIEELSVFQEKHLKQGLFLNQLEIYATSSQPLSLDVHTLLPVEKYFTSEDFYGSLNLDLQYTEFPEKVISWKLEGPLREGRVKSTGKTSLATNTYEAEVNLEHLPWAQFLKREGLPPEMQTIPKQSWLTALMRSKGNLGDKNGPRIEVERAKVEGQHAIVQTKPFVLQWGDKLDWDSIHIDIEKLRLSPFMGLFGVTQIPSALGDLGEFSGTAEIPNAEQFEISGKLTGMEFVFSNLGRRERQLVNFEDFQIRKNGHVVQASFDDLGTDATPRTGSIRLNMNLKTQEAESNVAFGNLRFSKNVNELFSLQMGDRGVSGNLKARWQNSRFTFLKWDLIVPSVSFPNFKIAAGHAQGFKTDDEISMRLNIPGLEVGPDILRDWNLRELSGNDEGLAMTDFNLTLKGASPQDLNWQSTADAKKDRLRMQGAWDPEGQLRGEITAKGSRNLRGAINGTRDNPTVQWQ